MFGVYNHAGTPRRRLRKSDMLAFVLCVCVWRGWGGVWGERGWGGGWKTKAEPSNSLLSLFWRLEFQTMKNKTRKYYISSKK